MIRPHDVEAFFQSNGADYASCDIVVDGGQFAMVFLVLPGFPLRDEFSHCFRLDLRSGILSRHRGSPFLPSELQAKLPKGWTFR